MSLDISNNSPGQRPMACLIRCKAILESLYDLVWHRDGKSFNVLRPDGVVYLHLLIMILNSFCHDMDAFWNHFRFMCPCVALERGSMARRFKGSWFENPPKIKYNSNATKMTIVRNPAPYRNH